MVNSATALALRPGVLTTTMPRWRAAFMSMFTGPPRDTATNLSLGRRSMIPAESGARWVTSISASPVSATTSSADPMYSFRPAIPSTA